jgi:hypothetical protein
VDKERLLEESVMASKFNFTGIMIKSWAVEEHTSGGLMLDKKKTSMRATTRDMKYRLMMQND